ncbi:MAG: hypothetical protein KDE20_00235 [Caldilineaceae bacterium]|nr:hypothetical protein [Caldilineaceae bacterium]
MGDEDDAVAVADAEAAPHRQIEHLRFRQAPAQGLHGNAPVVMGLRRLDDEPRLGVSGNLAQPDQQPFTLLRRDLGQRTAAAGGDEEEERPARDAQLTYGGIDMRNII